MKPFASYKLISLEKNANNSQDRQAELSYEPILYGQTGRHRLLAACPVGRGVEFPAHRPGLVMAIRSIRTCAWNVPRQLVLSHLGLAFLVHRLSRVLDCSLDTAQRPRGGQGRLRKRASSGFFINKRHMQLASAIATASELNHENGNAQQIGQPQLLAARLAGRRREFPADGHGPNLAHRSTSNGHGDVLRQHRLDSIGLENPVAWISLLSDWHLAAAHLGDCGPKNMELASPAFL